MNRFKMIGLGTVIFGSGIFVGFQSCKKVIDMMVHDKKFMTEKIFPTIEKEIGKEKLEQMAKIYYGETEEN